MTPELTLIGALLFAVGLASVIWIFVKSVRSIAKRTTPSQRLGNVLMKRTVVVVVGVILIGAGQFAFWINSNLTAFMPFDPHAPIGLISFRQPYGSYPIMHMAINTVNSRRLLPFEVEMRTGVAVLDIEILRFPKALAGIGLTQYCRISSVREIDPENPDFSDGRSWQVLENIEPFWEFFDAIDGILPIAKASRMESDPVVFERGVDLSVYATADGIAMSN